MRLMWEAGFAMIPKSRICENIELLKEQHPCLYFSREKVKEKFNDQLQEIQNQNPREISSIDI